jgi:fluoride ion exporter CrcB/FEX
MSYWVAFLIGAALGCVLLALSLVKRPIQGGHPVQGFLVAAVMGGLIIGTLIWVLEKVALAL